MQKAVIILAIAAVAGRSGKAWIAPSFDEVVDRAIASENSLLKQLRTEHPMAETYIQDLGPDADFGAVPKTDHYFLGKLDFSRGVNTDSYVQKGSKHGLDAFGALFSLQYVPRGFAQTMLIDGAEFDRAHYDFVFDHREFLGDVRTWVINVSPKKSAGRGRFIGRIWVEDKDFNIVRFNGTYVKPAFTEFYMHFDSWRINCGHNQWLPYETYSEESSLAYAAHLAKAHFKAVTQVWGYTTAADRNFGELTNITVDLPDVQDKSEQGADNSPVESLRAWERQSEDNILGRLEGANILATKGPVEKILDTVVNNLIVTNNLNITPEVRTRVMLTTPLETFTVGHTIVISRGLLDTLPDEASLAAILAHELAHIALGQVVDTRFAFSDRLHFDDDAILDKFRFARPESEEEAANGKAIELLQKSPYGDKLREPGLFLKALAAESDRLPNLIKPLFGSRLAKGNNLLRLSVLLQNAPQLQRTRIDQIAALPLGSRTSLDPWTNQLRMTTARTVPLLSAREKMAFELTPVYLHLRYASLTDDVAPAEAITATPQ
jgi:Peptidase family M48